MFFFPSEKESTLKRKQPRVLSFLRFGKLLPYLLLSFNTNIMSYLVEVSNNIE